MSAQTNGKSFWPKWDDNKLFTVILAIIGVYLIVLSGSMIRKNIKEGNRVGLDPVAAPTITVDGRGKVTASPNIASVQVGLLSEGTDVATIQEENSAKMNALLAELRRLVHGLAGSGTTFGFPAISQVARATELRAVNSGD